MGITPTATKSLLLTAYIPAATTINAYLVTTAVAAGNSTVAALTQASGGNYALQALTSTAPTISGVTAIVTTSANPVWTNLYTTAATPIAGVAFSKQVGGSASAADPVVGYSTLVAGVTVAACTTANNSVVISTTNSFTAAGFVAGQLITGSNISPGTTILEVTSATQLLLSQPATSTLAGSLTVTGYVASPYTPPTVSNTSTLTVPMPATGLLTFL